MLLKKEPESRFASNQEYHNERDIIESTRSIIRALRLEFFFFCFLSFSYWQRYPNAPGIDNSKRDSLITDRLRFCFNKR